jgi:hypothetical protein
MVFSKVAFRCAVATIDNIQNGGRFLLNDCAVETGVQIMKPILEALKRVLGYTFVTLAALCLCEGSAPAGLTVDVHLYHDNYGYYFYPYLSANSTLPNFPDGIYQVASPQIPSGGSRLVYVASGGAINGCYNNDCGGGSYYNSFDAMLYGITNGLWTITVTNAAATNVYSFPVTISGFNSNVFGVQPQAVYPANDAINVPQDATLQWIGPANWQGTLYIQEDAVHPDGTSTEVSSANLPPTATSWTPTTLMPLGTNRYSLTYQSNVTAMVTAAQPTNGMGQPISGWISTATLESDFAYNFHQDVYFTVGTPKNDYFPFLVGRFNFEDTNNPYADSSGNNNDNDCTSVNGPNQDTASTNAAVGNYARFFGGNTWFCFSPYAPGYVPFSNALAGNFSLSAWVNTTNTLNSDYANAYFGAPIFFSGADYNNDCTIPLAITGSKAAFTVVSTNGPGTITLHSQTSVNDGRYHFLTVTRQQSTGLMNLYVDGNLEATGTGITNPIETLGYVSIGGSFQGYAGLLDDVRLYATNLSAADVADLAGTGNFASAIGVTGLPVTTTGDAPWFVEHTNTYQGVLTAAQSGVISNSQQSTLSITVTGPGKLTFYWSSQDNDPNQGMDYEFYLDDPNTSDIADLYGGGNDWQSITNYTGGPVPVPPGQHTLNWTVYAGGDADPFQAGFLDNVVFTPLDTNPVSASMTFNIYHQQDPSFGDIYLGFPSFNSVTPAGTGTTTNRIESPNNFFNARSDQGGGGPSSAILYSLSSVLNEATNGLWSLYINYGLPNQRQFQFRVAINGLTTNLMPPVRMIAPTNQAVNFPPGGTLQWQGPLDYSALTVSKQDIDGQNYLGATLAPTATSWTPGLIPGTNRCDINYTSNNFPTVTFSTPVDTADSQTVSVWSASMNLNTTATAIFVVSSGAAPVRLVSPQAGGGNFQFSFQSQTGYTNLVQYRTNLTVGNWQTYSNVIGDGTLKTLAIPFNLFSPSPQGYIRVGTQ